MFHMGWFLKAGFGVQGWNAKWSGPIATEWLRPQFYIEMARSLEMAGFDYLMIEDSSMINDTYEGSMKATLARAAGAPKNDPMPLVPLITAGTKHIGVIATVTTSFYPPFLAARLGTTLDHLTEGRVGLNLVTASGHRAAQNYGLDQHLEHDLRYRMADEWMRVVSQLWESWEPGVVLADSETGIYADFSMVHPINFKGEFFKVRGPMNTIPGPQRRPVICQAGGSPAGRDLAAQHADTIVASSNGIPAMAAFQKDVETRLGKFGRSKKDCKTMFLISPVLGETDQEAQDRYELMQAGEKRDLSAKLERFSYALGVDLSKFHLDEPLPGDIHTRVNGHQSSVKELTRHGGTLRDMLKFASTESVPLVGSPDTVAARMAEIMEEVGGSGFLIGNTVTRHSISEVADGLAPALKRRKLIRDGFEHTLFRDNLLAF
jgi:FMN-dependent oxidoreductase (nitrilotriacetate monooxygenase family)